MRQSLWFVPFLLFSLAACQASPPKWAADVSQPEPQPYPPHDIEITDGQTLYVPVYSHVYWTETKHFPLAISLSIRNTDPEHAISLVDVSYYDSDGYLVESYLNEPRSLSHVASADYFIGDRDVRGGSGANFIVRWEASDEVYEPVVEAVMLATAGTQGISPLRLDPTRNGFSTRGAFRAARLGRVRSSRVGPGLTLASTPPELRRPAV